MMADTRRAPSASVENRGTAAMQEPAAEAAETTFAYSNGQSIDPKLIQHITENVIRQLQLANIPAPTASHRHGPQWTQPTKAQDLVDEIGGDSGVPLSKPSFKTENVFETPRVPSPATKLGEPTPGTPSYAGKESRRPGLQTIPSESKEATPLEKIWGDLFDESGSATPRLGQLFRGLATYLIEELEPKQNIVVTPEKMVEYYKLTGLDEEIYPWEMIFDDHEAYVSRMYRDFGCQHHLVQEEDHKRPDIPGLTPVGFARWMTLLLLAHPNDEFDRLRKAIVDLPIDNPDDRTERFPKDISRRLFPTTADIRLRNKFRKSMARHAEKARVPPPEEVEDAVDSVSETEPCLQHVHTNSNEIFRPRRDTEGEPSKRAISPRKEVHHASGKIPTVGADAVPVPDDEHLVPTQPIERERKPYTATEGGGRMYEEPAAIQPAGGRINNVYPVNGAPIPAGLGLNTVQSTPLPSRGSSSPTKNYPTLSGLPRQSSVSPPQAFPSASDTVLTRSDPGASKIKAPPYSGPASTVSLGAGGYASPPSAAAEVHQSQPPPTSLRTRRASTTRRRAPSGSQGLGLSSESAPNILPGSYPARQPAYGDMVDGSDGYGTYDEEVGGLRMPRNGAAIRRQSRERKRENFSERDRSVGMPSNRDEALYRDTVSYHLA